MIEFTATLSVFTEGNLSSNAYLQKLQVITNKMQYACTPNISRNRPKATDLWTKQKEPVICNVQRLKNLTLVTCSGPS